MTKKYIACSEKPIVAKWAERAVDEIEKILNFADTSGTDVDGYLTRHDCKILEEACEILLDFEREYTTSKRGY